jgi:hypothetical protein
MKGASPFPAGGILNTAHNKKSGSFPNRFF